MDLDRHKFVSYVDDLIEVPELLALNRVGMNGKIAFRSSTSAAQHAAVAAGAGIGMLHLLAARDDPRLVHLLAAEIEERRSYWLVMHPDMQRLPRVCAVIDFLERVIDSNRHRF